MCPIPQGAPSLSAVLTMIPLWPCLPLPMCPKLCPCAPLPMCPITHVPHPPRYPISICSIKTMIPLWQCLPLPMCPKLYPCAPLPMCPITHVPHPPRCPISISSINHDTPLTMFAIAHVSYCTWSSTCWYRCPLPMCLSPMCLLPSRCPISICSINHDTPLPMCPIAHMSKNMSSCQKDVKLSKRCQMSKSQTHGLWRRFTKKVNWHNEVHTYWCQFWHQIWWCSKTLKISIESIFDQFWWPSYLM